MSELLKCQQLFERDPTNLQAFISVCTAAERAGDFEYLAELLKYRTQITQDQQETVDLFFRAGEVYLDKMQDLTRGVETLLQGYEVDRTHGGIAQRLETIYRQAGDFQASLAILEGRLDAVQRQDRDGTQTTLRSDLHQQAGEIYEQQLKDEEKALAHYREAIELDKANTMALYRSREIYLKHGKYKNAAKLCELEARVETDKDRKIALYRELAGILSSHLNDHEQAVTALKRALKADQTSDEVKIELATAIIREPMSPSTAKDHKWASDFFSKLSGTIPGSEGLRYAGLALQAYPENEKALTAFSAKARETGDWDALIAGCKAAIPMIVSVNDQAPILRTIIRGYLRKGAQAEALQWGDKLRPVATADDMELISKLAETSKVSSLPSLDEDVPPAAVPKVPHRPSVAPPRPSAPPSAMPSHEAASASSPAMSSRQAGMSDADWAEQLRQEADRARRSGDDQNAEERMMQVLELFPQDQKATMYLERRFRAREDYMSLRDLLMKCLGSEDFPPAVQTVRLREAARISEEHLGDAAAAIDIWNTIRQHDPKVRDAKDALMRLLAETERWTELVALLQEEAETTKSRSKQVEAFQRLAEIYRIRLGNSEKAVETYQTVLELVPDDQNAIDALDEIYFREQDYASLVPLIDRRIALSGDPAEKVPHLLRAATLLRERLGNAEDAFQRCRSVLKLVPGQMDALEFMESIDEETQNFERQIETLYLKVEQLATPEEKSSCYQKIAAVASSRLGDSNGAIKAWKLVLQEDKANIEAMDSLVQLYEESSEYAAMIDVLQSRVETIDDRGDRIEILRKIATTTETKIGNEDMAMSDWRRILEIEEDEQALGALGRYCERKASWEELVDVLGRQAPLAPDHDSRADILFHRAEIIRDQIGDREQALSEFKKIYAEVNPTHGPTLQTLRDLLAEEGNYEEAVEILEQQIGYCTDNDTLRRLLVLCAEWVRDELKDLKRSMEMYEKAAAMDITDDAVLDALDAGFVEAGEWDKLLKMIYGRYQRSEDLQVRYDFLIRGGSICESELKDNPQAWIWYRQIFDHLREHENSISTLEEAASRMGLWKELIDVYAVMTRESESESDQVNWWLKIAEIFENRLDDPPNALQAVLRAFSLEPDHVEMLDSVDRLAVKGQVWERLATVYAVLAKRATAPEEKMERYLRHAKVLHEQGGQSGLGFDVALKAFEVDPSSEEMLEIVETIGEAAGRYSDLVRVYKVCADREDQAERRITLLMKAAVMNRDQLEDPDAAVERALDVLAIAPFEEETVKSVWELVSSLESDLLETEKGVYWAKIIQVYRQLIDANRKNLEKQVELTLVISRIHAEELKDNERAFEVLKEAQSLAPLDENTISRLEEMAGELDMWSDLAEHYRDILDETFEMPIAVMYHRRRAGILLEHLDRSEDAAEHYWQIIQLDAQDERAYASLLKYYESAEKWNELVNLLERQLDAATEDVRKQELLLQIADIWEHRIGNKYEAKDWYEQVITIWPANEDARNGLERLARLSSVRVDDEEDTDDEIQTLVSIPPPAGPTEDADAEEDTDEDVDEDTTTPSETDDALSEEEATDDLTVDIPDETAPLTADETEDADAEEDTDEDVDEDTTTTPETDDALSEEETTDDLPDDLPDETTPLTADETEDADAEEDTDEDVDEDTTTTPETDDALSEEETTDDLPADVPDETTPLTADETEDADAEEDTDEDVDEDTTTTPETDDALSEEETTDDLPDDLPVDVPDETAPLTADETEVAEDIDLDSDEEMLDMIDEDAIMDEISLEEEPLKFSTPPPLPGSVTSTVPAPPKIPSPPSVPSLPKIPAPPVVPPPPGMKKN